MDKRDNVPLALLRIAAAALLAILWATDAPAQSTAGHFELAAQLTSAASSEFDRTDVGIGGRVSWHPVAAIGVEAEGAVYPSDFPRPPAFSRGRVEGLFGITAGPQMQRVRPFAKIRPGVVRFQEAPAPLACILIVPPPLACAMAPGRTLFALDIGGGLSIAIGPRGFLRIDAGDRLLRYPGPAFDRQRVARLDGCYGHDLRLAVGAGVRFE